MGINWNHIICDECWTKKRPGHKPVRVTLDLKPLPCCYCGKDTQSGIFVREHPRNVKCRGKGDYHEEWHE